MGQKAKMEGKGCRQGQGVGVGHPGVGSMGKQCYCIQMGGGRCGKEGDSHRWVKKRKWKVRGAGRGRGVGWVIQGLKGMGKQSNMMCKGQERCW